MSTTWRVLSPLEKRSRSAMLATCSSSLLLFYESTGGTAMTASVCNDSEDLEKQSTQDMGSIVCLLTQHCMEPNTYKQAIALPNRDNWQEAIDTDIEMIRGFNVFSTPMKL